MKLICKTLLLLNIFLIGCSGQHQNNTSLPPESETDYAITYEPLPEGYQASTPTTAEVDALARAYGYLIGQQVTINKISAAFPEFNTLLSIYSNEFNSKFGYAFKQLSTELEKKMAGNFERFKNDLDKQSNNLHTNMTRTDAEIFISELERRSKGIIDSPVFETLLTYQFMNNPVREFTSGYVRQYTTAGHPKSEGLTLQARLPASWLKKEGNRPNVVNSFVSNNGKGDEMILFMVRDLGLPRNYKLSELELREFYTETELKHMIPEGAVFIAAKPIKLDGNLGGQIIYSMRAQALDEQFNTQFVWFFTIHNNKMIMMQGAVHAADDEDIESRFRLFFPLFRIVATSMVLVDKYR